MGRATNQHDCVEATYLHLFETVWNGLGLLQRGAENGLQRLLTDVPLNGHTATVCVKWQIGQPSVRQELAGRLHELEAVTRPIRI